MGRRSDRSSPADEQAEQEREEPNDTEVNEYDENEPQNTVTGPLRSTHWSNSYQHGLDGDTTELDDSPQANPRTVTGPLRSATYQDALDRDTAAPDVSPQASRSFKTSQRSDYNNYGQDKHGDSRRSEVRRVAASTVTGPLRSNRTMREDDFGRREMDTASFHKLKGRLYHEILKSTPRYVVRNVPQVRQVVRSCVPRRVVCCDDGCGPCDDGGWRRETREERFQRKARQRRKALEGWWTDGEGEHLKIMFETRLTGTLRIAGEYVPFRLEGNTLKARFQRKKVTATINSKGTLVWYDPEQVLPSNFHPGIASIRWTRRDKSAQPAPKSKKSASVKSASVKSVKSASVAPSGLEDLERNIAEKLGRSLAESAMKSLVVPAPRTEAAPQRQRRRYRKEKHRRRRSHRTHRSSRRYDVVRSDDGRDCQFCG